MSIYENPRAAADQRLMQAAISLGRARTALEVAEDEYNSALNAVEWLKDRDRENRLEAGR